MNSRKHVSNDEKKKIILIILLIIILIAIIFTIINIVMLSQDDDDNVSDQFGNNNIRDSYENNVDENDENDVSETDTSNNNSKESKGNDLDIIARDKSKVSITVKPGTLTVDGAVIVINDSNINPYSWSPIYKLQQKVDGVWQDMKLENPENMLFPDIQYDNTTGVMEQSLVWSNKYGKLGIGEYRIVKETSGIEFYAEFEVK